MTTTDMAERRLPRLSSPLVLFTGGKGGIGKTTLATNVALHIGRQGYRVLVTDLDLGMANVNVLLGLEIGRDVADVFAEQCHLSDCVVPGPCGVDVLPASSGIERMGRLDDGERHRLFTDLSELAGDYDLVIGDTAAGIGPDVLAFSAAADRVVSLTSPEVSVLTDAFGQLKALDQYSNRTGIEIPTPEVLVNQAASVEEARGISRKLRDVCERFLSRSPAPGGWMPRSAVIASSTRSQTPFAMRDVPDLERHCLGRVSERVLSVLDSDHRVPGC